MLDLAYTLLRQSVNALHRHQLAGLWIERIEVNKIEQTSNKPNDSPTLNCISSGPLAVDIIYTIDGRFQLIVLQCPMDIVHSQWL